MSGSSPSGRNAARTRIPSASKIGSAALGRRLARRVAVEQQHDFLGVAAQAVRVVLGERGPARRHHLVQAGAVQREQVEVALDHDHAAARANRVERLAEPEQRAVLLVDGRLGRVQVLRRVVAHRAPAEAGDLTAGLADREHDPAAEAVVVAVAVLAAREKPRGLGVRGRDAARGAGD